MAFGPSPSTFRTTPTVIFGRGAVSELPDQLKRAGAGHVLVVTDGGVEASGILDQVASLLDESDISYGIYTEVVPEPPSPSVDACAEAIKAAGGS